MTEQQVVQASPPVQAKLHVNFDPNYQAKEVDFHFKKDKELGIKRPSVKLQVPAATPNLAVAILEAGGPQLDLLLEAMNDYLIGVARQQVNENSNITQETLDVSKISWEALANMPKAARRGGGISKETWDDFQKDYIECMPGMLVCNLLKPTSCSLINFKNNSICGLLSHQTLMTLQTVMSFSITRSLNCLRKMTANYWLTSKLV
jgi:hypothetical protein